MNNEHDNLERASDLYRIRSASTQLNDLADKAVDAIEQFETEMVAAKVDVTIWYSLGHDLPSIGYLKGSKGWGVYVGREDAPLVRAPRELRIVGARHLDELRHAIMLELEKRLRIAKGLKDEKIVS